MKRRSFLLLGASFALSSELTAETDKVESTGSRLTHAEVKTLLQLHNDARSKVGVKPLVWSSRIAGEAQKWADYLASSGNFRHSNGPYGENLAGAGSLERAIGMWLAERATYRNRRVGGSSASGHYTQMVWSKTKLIGCGKAKGPKYTIWVCQYDPPGNVRGQRPY